jgi:AcrR family transcriptional regulator
VAVAVADAEGAEAVNMRRIARQLDVGTMSLYWHVADKSHLLDLMLDAIFGEMQSEGATGDWRHDLARISRQEHATLLQHRWFMDFIGGRPPLGPNTVLHLEQSLAVLDDLDLDTRTAIDVLMTLNTYVMGAVLRELREMRSERDQEEGGLDAASERSAFVAWKDRLRTTGQFVRFLHIFEAGIDPDSPDTRDERFEFGLQCVLDGIAARIAAASAVQRAP